MVATLGAYGSVMLAHYKPNNRSQATFERDLCILLTEQSLSDLTAEGLFAWSFMDDTNLAASEDIFRFARAAVRRFGTQPAGRSEPGVAADEPDAATTPDTC
jgi:hypothetical protein